MNGPTLRGRLLVALPPLVDENFDRTVVLMLEHSDGGALGVVLNRPGDRDVAERARALGAVHVAAGGDLRGRPGGDASRSSGWPWPTAAGEEGAQLGARLRRDRHRSTSDRDPTSRSRAVEALRLFAGYAGWAPDQLEQELAAGAWIVADFRTDDAFGPDPATLWRTVLRRQGGQVAWMANYPDEPAVN